MVKTPDRTARCRVVAVLGRAGQKTALIGAPGRSRGLIWQPRSGNKKRPAPVRASGVLSFC